jgi:hypothetical protein
VGSWGRLRLEQLKKDRKPLVEAVAKLAAMDAEIAEIEAALATLEAK